MEWRAVPSQPHLEVSNEGLVRIVSYSRPTPYGGIRRYGGNPRKGSWDGSRLIIQVGGKSFKVARLVCEAFHGPAPAGKPNVLHRDENARNNRFDNLYWGTQKENLNAPGFIAYCKGRIGENHPRTKSRKP